MPRHILRQYEIIDTNLEPTTFISYVTQTKDQLDFSKPLFVHKEQIYFYVTISFHVVRYM